MREDEKTEDMLEALFDAAKDAPLEASPALMARVLADADAVLAGQRGIGAAPRPTPKQRLAGIWAALGGWPAMGGLVTATAFGIWLGFSPMTNISTVAAGFMFGDSSLGSLDADYAWLDTLGDV